MPRHPINRSTNFIVEKEAWTVVEYDHTSVPGVIYLSLTEDKINSIYDDVENNLAETDRIIQYDLSVPSTPQIFNINEIIVPQFTLTANGIPSEEPITLITTNKSIAKNINGKLTAVAEGTVDIIVQLINYPNIQKTITIQVGEQKQFSAYIEGAATIHLDRESSYVLKGTEELINTVNFELEKTSLAKIISTDTNKDYDEFLENQLANDDNELGFIVLHALYNNNDYIKRIEIIPLWR